MFDELGKQAAFFIVYIAEAHSVDGWQTDSNEAEGIRIAQPTTFDERQAAAWRCANELGLTVPTLVDRMDDAAIEAFAAWPERVYVIDAGGIVRYRGGPGPYEFDPAEAWTALRSIL